MCTHHLPDLRINTRGPGQSMHRCSYEGGAWGLSLVYHGFFGYPKYIISCPITPRSENVGNAHVRGRKVPTFEGLLWLDIRTGDWDQLMSDCVKAPSI